MTKLIFFAILLFIFQNLYCQKTNGADEIQKYFSEAALGKSFYLTPDIIKSLKTQTIVKTAKPYLNDPKDFVRYKAIDLIKRKGLSVSDTLDREVITSLLLEACKDKDSGNSGTASQALTMFNLEDFSIQATDSIISLLKLRPFHYERVIRVAGFLQSEKIKEALSILVNDSGLNKKEKWTVNLALARIGDEHSIDLCMQKVKNTEVNDNVINYLFPDLVYMRQPVSIKYMLNEILSDEKKCLSSNPDKETSIICAYKIMELVAPVIEGFPVKVTSYGELDIEDYDLALINVRNWVAGNPQFHLVKNIF